MPNVQAIYTAYLRGSSMEALALAFGVSRFHVQWAIDEALRQRRKLSVVNG